MTNRLRPCELGVENPSKRCSNSNHNLIKNLPSAQTACVEEPDLQALRQSVSNHVVRTERDTVPVRDIETTIFDPASVFLNFLYLVYLIYCYFTQ